ncbi:MAG: ABC transporter substrate-binding protein [Firmicutes bacterium]|nr:ABC transporter substrate-binding protein [Bacillota bacterium]
MRKSLKIVTCLVLIAAMLTGLTGCTTFNNFKNAFFSENQIAKEKTIKIGIYEPLSGENKAQGKEEIMGIELAHELHPEVLGKKIELVYADNKSNMYDAETAITELMSNSPDMVLGSYGETLTLIASDYIKASNTPAITISSTNPLITINNPYYFSATYTETRQGDALADFAFENQHRDVVATVGIYQHDTATATFKRFTNRIKKLTGNSKSAVGSFVVMDDTTDFSDTIEQIRNSGAKAVFLAFSPQRAQAFMEQCIDKNLTHVLFLGPRNWNDEAFIKFVKQNDKLNVAFCGEQAQALSAGLSTEFLNAYAVKYGADAVPAGRTAAAFDAYMLAIRAIEDAYNGLQSGDVNEAMTAAKTEAEAKAVRDIWYKAVEEGVPDGTHIRAALAAIEDFQGASGTINYGGSNEPTKTITINHISGGMEMPAYVVE